MTALEELLGFIDLADPLSVDADAGELEALRLRAANERLAAQRAAIPVLDQRCAETGIDVIKTREDLVPLLFTHATYKTYPASFVSKGQWDRLSLWLQTVTVPEISRVDVSGVADIDEWMDRLKEAGFHLVATSGTSGKNSFLLMDDDDISTAGRAAVSLFAWPHRIPHSNDRPAVLGVPGNAPMRYGYGFKAYCAAFVRPGAAHTLTEERMRLADTLRATQLRKAMAEGTVTPGELEQLKAEDAARKAKVDAQINALADTILGYRDEPQILIGPWATAWRVMEIAHERGIPDGTFHPGTIASITGGLKGMTMPPDYQEQMAAFLGPVLRPKLYAMSEISTTNPLCEAGYYHVPAWMTLLILDESGERLLEPDDAGRVTGRVAFYDPVWQARWGGIVSGDQATVTFRECECGRPGPVIDDSIQRYSELSAGGDDKLTCGGTIEQYIRGVVDA